jgi:hypothetical protein
VSNTGESAKATAQRLTEELIAAVHEAAPSATWLTPATIRYTEKDPKRPGVLFAGGGNLQFDGRAGNIDLVILPTGRMPACADFATTETVRRRHDARLGHLA